MLNVQGLLQLATPGARVAAHRVFCLTPGGDVLLLDGHGGIAAC